MSSVFTKTAMLVFVMIVGLSFATAGIVAAQPEDPEDLVDLTLPLDLDDEDVDWENAFFPFEGASAVRYENPDQSGINETDYVLRYAKEGGEPWAGFFFHTEEVIEITDESVATMKVWSHRDDMDAMMKFEMQDADVESPELFAEVTEAEEWIELEWDLDEVDQETPWDVVTIIFDLEGDAGDGSDDYVWYLDDFNVDERTANSAHQPENEVVEGFELEQNYPNPFNPTTQIDFTIPHQSDVQLTVYNMLGQQVDVLVDESLSAGTHSVTFDAANLPSGNYIYRLEAGDFSQTQHMSLIK